MEGKLNNCPICQGSDLEEDWDGLSEGMYDHQIGYLDCKSCKFGISQVLSTEFVPSWGFTEELYKLWNSIRIGE